MKLTPYADIPSGASYVMDGYGSCSLLEDALRVPGSKVAGGFWDAPGASQRLLVRVKPMSKEERYAGKKTATVSAEAFDPEKDGELWK